MIEYVESTFGKSRRWTSINDDCEFCFFWAAMDLFQCGALDFRIQILHNRANCAFSLAIEAQSFPRSVKKCDQTFYKTLLYANILVPVAASILILCAFFTYQDYPTLNIISMWTYSLMFVLICLLQIISGAILCLGLCKINSIFAEKIKRLSTLKS
jgi:hypothetical protein